MKGFKFILSLWLVLMLTSCFEVIEDITISDDGSGHIKVILNASQSRSDINALLLLKEINGYPIPSIEQLNAKVDAFKDSVKTIDGFSNVITNFDDENFILIIEADFDKVERLNNGIYAMWRRFDPINAKRESYFEYRNKTFVRRSGQLFNILYLRMKNADRKVLNGATFTALYRFSTEVNSQKNPVAKTSPNKKVVFLKLPLQLMIEKPSYWYNMIILN